MRVLPRRLALAAMLTLLAAACGGRSQTNGEPTPATVVRVTNQNFLDMNVYVLRGAERVRLGTVSGNRTERFTLPGNLVFGGTPVRFLADPIGSSRTAQSFEITVSPGDEVTLTIPPGAR